MRTRGLLAAVGMVLGLAGCGGAEAPKAAKPAEYPVSGVVRSVDPPKGRVTIRHQAIAGYMPVMTMPFDVPDRDILTSIREGDRVTATLRVSGKESWLTDLKKVGDAEDSEAIEKPETLVLDGSGRPVTSSAAPKRLAVGEPVPDFAMTDQDGRPLKLSELRGKVVAMTFIFTRCPRPDFCPRMDERFAELAKQIAVDPRRADEVRLLSVSFDPEHDSPEVLARHAALKGAKPPLWRFAVASHPELAKVLVPLGLIYGPRQDEIIHNLVTLVIDRDGTLVRLEGGSSWTPESLFGTIRDRLRR